MEADRSQCALLHTKDVLMRHSRTGTDKIRALKMWFTPPHLAPWEKNWLRKDCMQRKVHLFKPAALYLSCAFAPSRVWTVVKTDSAKKNWHRIETGYFLWWCSAFFFYEFLRLLIDQSFTTTTRAVMHCWLRNGPPPTEEIFFCSPRQKIEKVFALARANKQGTGSGNIEDMTRSRNVGRIRRAQAKFHQYRATHKSAQNTLAEKICKYLRTQSIKNLVLTQLC